MPFTNPIFVKLIVTK